MTSTKAIPFLIWTRRLLTTGLTTIAFVNSYGHTVQWFADNGQAPHAGWLGTIPEIGVILVVLVLATANISTPVKRVIQVIGALSLGITMTANVSGAVGVAGIVAALVAPVFAVLGFALEVLSIAPAPKPASKPRKAPQNHKKPARLTKFDEGVLWATEQAEWPTTAQIMAQFPQTSQTTARKIRRAQALQNV